MKSREEIEHDDYDTNKANQREMWSKYVDGISSNPSQTELDARHLCIKYAQDERHIADLLVKISKLLKANKKLKKEHSDEEGIDKLELGEIPIGNVIKYPGMYYSIWLIWTFKADKREDIGLSAICTTEEMANKHRIMYEADQKDGNLEVFIEKRELDHGYGHEMLTLLKSYDHTKRTEDHKKAEKIRIMSRICNAPEDIIKACKFHTDEGHCSYFSPCPHLEWRKKDNV